MNGNEISLKEHLESRLAQSNRQLEQRINDLEKTFGKQLSSIDKANLAAQANAEKAITIAQSVSNKRLDELNNFRDAMKDLQANQITRSEVEAFFKTVNERITAIKSTLDKEITTLSNRIGLIEGKGIGLKAGWIYLIGFISLVGILITIFFKLR